MTVIDVKVVPRAAKDEIVVTGTLIRGIAPGGSQSIAVGQEKIESLGATTTSDLIASVPQAGNFLAFVGVRGSSNFSLAVNRPVLRYLGFTSSSTASTLLLVDGHRLIGGLEHVVEGERGDAHRGHALPGRRGAGGRRRPVRPRGAGRGPPPRGQRRLEVEGAELRDPLGGPVPRRPPGHRPQPMPVIKLTQTGLSANTHSQTFHLILHSVPRPVSLSRQERRAA